MWFNNNHTLADSSRMNTQHSAQIMAEVPPCEAVLMSKAILFWKTAFLIRDISVFSKDRLCRLSFKACWVNELRVSVCAIMSSRPMERTDTAAKWSYQWETERAYLALRKGRLASFNTRGRDSSLCPRKTVFSTCPYHNMLFLCEGLHLQEYHVHC